MDQLFIDVIGKPVLNQPKIITIVTENFSLLENKSNFLRATLAIPSESKLPTSDLTKRLVQIGEPSVEIASLAQCQDWILHQYDSLRVDAYESISNDLSAASGRSLVVINDLTRLLLTSDDLNLGRKFLVLAENLKKQKGHFIVLIIQGLGGCLPGNVYRDIEFLSDAFIKVISCPAGYFMTMWWETISKHKTLISPPIQTKYCTCKIGKSYWSSDSLCFYETKTVPRNYDHIKDSFIDQVEEENSHEKGDENCDEPSKEDRTSDRHLTSRADNDDETKTLPYIRAQNPEKSRIFYYPDKDDDFDEEDPDNDLNI